MSFNLMLLKIKFVQVQVGTYNTIGKLEGY